MVQRNVQLLVSSKQNLTQITLNNNYSCWIAITIQYSTQIIQLEAVYKKKGPILLVEHWKQGRARTPFRLRTCLNHWNEINNCFRFLTAHDLSLTSRSRDGIQFLTLWTFLLENIFNLRLFWNNNALELTFSKQYFKSSWQSSIARSNQHIYK